MATPFVQGRLREETLTVEAVTRCAVTGRELRLRIASDLRCEVLSEGAAPFVFEPRLDWQQFSAPNIIHDYWANSVFFWSEEQIHVHRQWPGVLDGTYLTLEQSAFQTPVSQGRLFAFAADLL